MTAEPAVKCHRRTVTDFPTRVSDPCIVYGAKGGRACTGCPRILLPIEVVGQCDVCSTTLCRRCIDYPEICCCQKCLRHRVSIAEAMQTLNLAIVKQGLSSVRAFAQTLPQPLPFIKTEDGGQPDENPYDITDFPLYASSAVTFLTDTSGETLCLGCGSLYAADQPVSSKTCTSCLTTLCNEVCIDDTNVCSTCSTHQVSLDEALDTLRRAIFAANVPRVRDYARSVGYSIPTAKAKANDEEVEAEDEDEEDEAERDTSASEEERRARIKERDRQTRVDELDQRIQSYLRHIQALDSLDEEGETSAPEDE